MLGFLNSVYSSTVLVLQVRAFLLATWHWCVSCVWGDQFVDQLLSLDLLVFMGHVWKVFAVIESISAVEQKGRNSAKNIRLRKQSFLHHEVIL